MHKTKTPPGSLRKVGRNADEKLLVAPPCEQNIAELLAMPIENDHLGVNEFDWTPPKISKPLHKDVDLS